jgi:hypothetical protein
LGPFSAEELFSISVCGIMAQFTVTGLSRRGLILMDSTGKNFFPFHSPRQQNRGIGWRSALNFAADRLDCRALR